jgi:hypothetical protein
MQPSLQEGNPDLKFGEWIHCNRKATKVPDCRGVSEDSTAFAPHKRSKISSVKTDRFKTAPERIGSGPSFSL